MGHKGRDVVDRVRSSIVAPATRPSKPIVVRFVDGERGIARETLRGPDVFLPTDGNRRVRRHTRQKHVGDAREVRIGRYRARSEISWCLTTI